MKFYSLYPEENDSQGVAYAPEGVTFKLLYGKSVIVDWKVIGFTLNDGDFTDYQSNDLGWHMCSEKLMSLLIECAGPEDAIQWLPVVVSNADLERHTYHVLHLPTPIDVLSKTRTIVSGGRVVKPVLDASKVGARRIFTFSDSGVFVYVNEVIRKRILAEKISGLNLLNVPAVPSE